LIKQAIWALKQKVLLADGTKNQPFSAAGAWNHAEIGGK